MDSAVSGSQEGQGNKKFHQKSAAKAGNGATEV